MMANREMAEPFAVLGRKLPGGLSFSCTEKSRTLSMIRV
jgi:hypothetical protein